MTHENYIVCQSEDINISASDPVFDCVLLQRANGDTGLPTIRWSIDNKLVPNPLVYWDVTHATCSGNGLKTTRLSFRYPALATYYASQPYTHKVEFIWNDANDGCFSTVHFEG